jgi:hypothetical protein
LLSKPVASELESLRVLWLECGFGSGQEAVSMAGMPRLRWLCMKGMNALQEVLPTMDLKLQARAEKLNIMAVAASHHHGCCCQPSRWSVFPDAA